MAGKTQDNRLYVAGVSWNTTDEGFKAFFSAFGTVSDAMIMREPSGRSRGFGFVTYEDSSSVDAVMGQQRQLDGRKLDIKAAQSKDEMASDKATPRGSSKKLYVAGLAFSLTDDDLFNFFAKFGEIERAEIMKDKATGKSRGFGFITFSQEGGVTAAIEAQEQAVLQLGGRNLEIKASLPRGSSALAQGGAPTAAFGGFGRQMPMQQMAYGRAPVAVARAPAPAFAGSPPRTKLYVAGLLFTTKEDVFRAYFEAFGNVTDVYISKNKEGESRGFGFITFSTEAEARDVAGKLHLVEGKRVDVKPATPKPGEAQPFAPVAGGYQQMVPSGYGYEDQYAHQQPKQQQLYPAYDSYGQRGGFEEEYNPQGAYNTRGGYGAAYSRASRPQPQGYHPYSR